MSQKMHILKNIEAFVFDRCSKMFVVCLKNF